MNAIKCLGFVSIFILASSALAESHLVGHWVPASGDSTWARIEISRDFLVTAFRSCAKGQRCERRTEFQLTTYGRRSVPEPTATMGSGTFIDMVHKFSATEVVELRAGRLFLREYLYPIPLRESPGNMLKTTFVRAPQR
ncbi:MAG: hypothetical protein OM95_13430 [Bdellovibrio sp. ArHS]|uniref:hypothetical protein n=1 Tax=Bdellovibrio sp. ArHS TaxID=1569284 RepID=UPI0005835DFA|nr:hypothetical protein [Bdellovibrio sp. ArHS]KHD87589.1 MAG: hypothetical protein OM95_13430 [Bdellovibrio sp. ArHS]